MLSCLFGLGYCCCYFVLLVCESHVCVVCCGFDEEVSWTCVCVCVCVCLLLFNNCLLEFRCCACVHFWPRFLDLLGSAGSAGTDLGPGRSDLSFTRAGCQNGVTPLKSELGNLRAQAVHYGGRRPPPHNYWEGRGRGVRDTTTTTNIFSRHRVK